MPFFKGCRAVEREAFVNFQTKDSCVFLNGHYLCGCDFILKYGKNCVLLQNFGRVFAFPKVKVIKLLIYK